MIVKSEYNGEVRYHQGADMVGSVHLREDSVWQVTDFRVPVGGVGRAFGYADRPQAEALADGLFQSSSVRMNLWSITRKNPDCEQPTMLVVVADDENNARIFAARHANANGGASWALELVLPEGSDVELIGLALESHDAGTVVLMG